MRLVGRWASFRRIDFMDSILLEDEDSRGLDRVALLLWCSLEGTYYGSGQGVQDKL